MHLMNGTELYSLNDLVDLQSGELTKFLVRTIETMARHITKECARCVGRGFICELCDDRNRSTRLKFSTIQCRRCSENHRKWESKINEHSAGGKIET